MKIAFVTGSCGLIGSQSVEYLSQKKFKVVGFDNDYRKYFFGAKATTGWMKSQLISQYKNYDHNNIDIRQYKALEKVFQKYGKKIDLIIHTAAQPSHDWAAREPITDFTINALATLNLLELTRLYCPNAVFIFTSTNKVYGDLPNRLPLIEGQSRYDIPKSHKFYHGIDESMSIDQSTHSLFGASKVSADVLVQEYGRYFGLKTGTFRAGCLTGPKHAGTMLHGFLSYLMYCCATETPYNIFGYKGKQVRDNIHSLDLVEAFYEFYKNPRAAEVYNIGGGRNNSCSVLEAIALCEEITGKKLKYRILKNNRQGDHIWYISSLKKFSKHYPRWKQKYTLRETLREIYTLNQKRWNSVGKRT